MGNDNINHGLCQKMGCIFFKEYHYWSCAIAGMTLDDETVAPVGCPYILEHLMLGQKFDEES